MQSSKTSSDLKLLDSEYDASSFEHFSVVLNNNELEAVEGWRAAHNIQSMGQALRELVRLGLLSELSDAHELIAQLRKSVD